VSILPTIWRENQADGVGGLVVNLQLDQRDDAVQDVLPSQGARLSHRHVSGSSPIEPGLTRQSVSSSCTPKFSLFGMYFDEDKLHRRQYCRIPLHRPDIRAGMATGSVLIMAAAAILTAAQNDSYLLGMLALVFAQISRLTNGLIGGRFLLGFGVSIGTSSAPTYALELAPPQWRARVVGYYNTCPHMFSILLPADVLQSSTPARSSPPASPTLLPNLTPSSPSASRSAYSLSLPYLSSSAPS